MIDEILHLTSNKKVDIEWVTKFIQYSNLIKERLLIAYKDVNME